MAYITYVVIAGFVLGNIKLQLALFLAKNLWKISLNLILGMQDRFSPEQLGIQASSALAYTIFELIIYSITLYVANIPTTLKTLDLLAYSGYKYSIIVACILISLLFKKMGYFLSLIYCGLSLAVFLVSISS